MADKETKSETRVEDARFEELRFYQLAQTLLEAVYRLAKHLPKHERYNMASQMRRAALSTVLNIAEGYGRYHFPDKLRFFYYARGSLFETLNGFIAAHAVVYIDDEQIAWARETTAQAGIALNGYINHIRRQKQGAETFGDKHIQQSTVVYNVASLHDPAESPIPNSQSPIPKQEDT